MSIGKITITHQINRVDHHFEVDPGNIAEFKVYRPYHSSSLRLKARLREFPEKLEEITTPHQNPKDQWFLVKAKENSSTVRKRAMEYVRENGRAVCGSLRIDAKDVEIEYNGSKVSFSGGQ